MALTRAACQQSRRPDAKVVRPGARSTAFPGASTTAGAGADTGAAGATKPPTGRHRRSENDCTARDGKPAARLAADEPTEAPDVHIRFRRGAGGSSLALKIRGARGGRHDHANPTQRPPA